MTFADLKVGDRLRLTKPMKNDPDPIPVGTEGTVYWLNDLSKMKAGMYQIGVNWDNGRSLSLIEQDSWEKIDG